MKRLFIILIVLALIVAAVAFWLLRGTPDDAADSSQPTVQVSTIMLKRASLPAEFTAYGSIGPGAGAEVTITTQAGGLVAAMPAVQGQQIAAGETLAVIAADPQSVAARAKALTAVKAARSNRAHVAALLASHLATRADLANANQVLADAASTLGAMQAMGTGTKQRIVAPFTGVVSALLTSPGSLAAAGTGLLRLINTRALVANIGVSPAVVASVREGEAAKVTLLDSGVATSAVVLQTTVIPDTQTGLDNVILAFASAAPLGTPVRATITTRMLTGYAVPRDAVQTDAEGDYVFQLDTKNIAHRETAHVLGQLGPQSILAPSLNTAMPLVTTGAYQLSDGAAVRMGSDNGAPH